MAISSTQAIAIYFTNSSDVDFAFPYYVAQASDIHVSSQVSLAHYGLGTDYSILESPDAFGAYPNGLTVHFFTPPPLSEAKILIARKTKIVQNIQFFDNDPFTAESLNHALDRLTIAIQDCDPGITETGAFKGVAFGPPMITDVEYMFGDWFKNVLPQAIGIPFGWVCIFNGIPGTWAKFGIIESL